MTRTVICVLCNCSVYDSSNATAYYFYDFESLNKLMSSDDSFISSITYLGKSWFSDEKYDKFVEINKNSNAENHEKGYWFYTMTYFGRGVNVPYKLFTKSLFYDESHCFSVLGWDATVREAISNYHEDVKYNNDYRYPLLHIYFKDNRITCNKENWIYLVNNREKFHVWFYYNFRIDATTSKYGCKDDYFELEIPEKEELSNEININI
jgi:hypothetical protein